MSLIPKASVFGELGMRLMKSAFLTNGTFKECMLHQSNNIGNNIKKMNIESDNLPSNSIDIKIYVLFAFSWNFDTICTFVARKVHVVYQILLFVMATFTFTKVIH